MKKTFALVTLFASLSFLASAASYAGCGAIACNTNGDGACGVSYGWDSQASAESSALSYCYANQSSCYIYSWECNECTYGPNGSYACN